MGGLLWGIVLLIKDAIRQSKKRKEMYEEIFMKADYQGGNNDRNS